MKLILTLLIVSFCTYAQASIYVLHKPSGEVIGLSEKNDIIAEQGQMISKIDGTISELALVHNHNMYLFKNNKLKANINKIQEEELEVIKLKKRNKELQRIERKKNKMAFEALKAEGVKFQEIKEADFEEVQ